MSTDPTGAAPDEREAPMETEELPERNTRLLIVLGVLAAVSAVVAGFVIFGDGPRPATEPTPPAQVRVGESSAAPSLTLGRASAPTAVVVYEDLASPESRSFEIASRDVLDIAAARGRVRVDYRPVLTGGSSYAAGALTAWAAVLDAGTPRQALRFRQELFDRQPADGGTSTQFLDLARRAGIRDAAVLDRLGQPDAQVLARSRRAAEQARVTSVPTVLVDGRRLEAGNPVELADRLQRELVRREG